MTSNNIRDYMCVSVSVRDVHEGTVGRFVDSKATQTKSANRFIGISWLLSMSPPPRHIELYSTIGDELH